jgi:hypothetical protein
VTEANQTTSANNTVRVTYNSTLRGGVAGIAGIIDPDIALESLTATGKWQAPDGNAMTADGTHPNRFGYLRVQSYNVVPLGGFTR